MWSRRTQPPVVRYGLDALVLIIVPFGIYNRLFVSDTRSLLDWIMVSLGVLVIALTLIELYAEYNEKARR